MCSLCLSFASNKTIRKSLAVIVSAIVDFVTQNSRKTITEEHVHVYRHANYNGALSCTRNWDVWAWAYIMFIYLFGSYGTFHD